MIAVGQKTTIGKLQTAVIDTSEIVPVEYLSELSHK